MNYRTETYGDVAAIAVVDERGCYLHLLRRHNNPYPRLADKHLRKTLKGCQSHACAEGEQLVTVACTPSEEDQEKPEETAAEEVSPAEDSENSKTEE